MQSGHFGVKELLELKNGHITLHEWGSRLTSFLFPSFEF